MKASINTERPGLFDANFVSRLTSSQQISKLEANRLELQWKKICEHEKKSKERNRELLKDFERVEQHAAMLAVKTERLKAYKQQYENYINKMYPGWREELENFRLSQQQSRNASNGMASHAHAPPIHSSSSLRASQLEPHYTGNTLLSSTPAQPARYERSPPQAGYPVNQQRSHLQDPYSKLSYQDSPQLYGGNMPPTGHMPSDNRWQSSGYYDSHRNFDSRVSQDQFAASRREPDYYRPSDQFAASHREPAYYRSPDQYMAPPGDHFYDRRPPPGEVPKSVPPDSRYMHPDVPQRARPVAPYEPRTELQRSYLGHRQQPGPYDQNGYPGHYYDERQGGYRGYAEDQRPADERQGGYRGYAEDQRSADGRQGGYRGHVEDQRSVGYEPHRMERSIGNDKDEPHGDKPTFMTDFPTSPIMASNQDTTQDKKQSSPPETRLTHPTQQPFVPPEKPLERSVPTKGFPDPSLSSTVSESPLESKNERSHEVKEDDSFTLPSISQATSNAAAETPEKGILLKYHDVPSDEETHTELLAEKACKPDIEPDKTVEVPQYGKEESVKVDSEEVKNEKVANEVPETNKEADERKELSDEDDEESLDLSDLSLPDGNEKYAPSFMPSQRKPSKQEKDDDTVFRKDSEVSTGFSKPVAVPEATKSVTEDISEDIPESVALEGDEDFSDVPVRDVGKDTILSGGKQVTEQSKMLDIGDEEKYKKEKDINEAIGKGEAKIPVEKTEEDRTPSVSVDGFLCLLQAVDADVEVSFSPEALYHSPRCSSDMREEITRSAEDGNGVESFDPNTISMIVLEELPLLVSSSSARCLIPDRVFSERVSCETEKELRPFLEPSLLKLWKALFSHLVNVVKNKVMSAEQAGDMFGSLLITQSSKHGKESQSLLCRILEAAVSGVSSHSASPPPSPTAHDLDLDSRFETEAPYEQDDKVSVASGGSSSTLGSTPPKVELDKPNEENRKPTPDPTVSYDDDFEDDVPLTETAAYLKMMSSAHSEPDDDISDILGDSGPQKQPESEADDDVERELARSISPPLTSPRVRSPSQSKTGKQKPKLSLFDTGAEKKDEKALGDSWGASSLKSVKSDISDSESVVSPPLSPDGVVGYTPTALENNEQKNKLDKENEKSEPKSANDSKAKRKTDFWNASDTESDVDLQLSTGGMDQDDDDDFDFYG